MSAGRERSGSEQANPNRGQPRWLRATIGSVLAFIAGMAVMLAIVLPFLSINTPTQIAAFNPHAGLGSLTVTGPVAQQKCAACHASPITAAP